MGRRSSSGITSFLSDIVDDIKDFVDDEVIDRGRDSERDLRRAGRNWTDSGSGNGGDGRRSGRGSGRAGSAGDLGQVREAIRALSKKIEALDSGSGSSAGSGSDLPITGYDDLTATEIVERLGSLSQSDLAKVASYERAHADRVTVTGRIESLTGEQPWDGYDEQTVVDIRKELMKADQSTQRDVRDYEARHKNRQGVLDAVETSLSAT